MRDIFKVIDQIKAATPTSESGFYRRLCQLQHNFKYKAPEQIQECWLELCYVLDEFLGNPDVEWKKNIQAIIEDRAASV